MGRNRRNRHKFSQQKRSDDEQKNEKSEDGRPIDDRDRVGYRLSNRTNEDFIKYYQKQNIVPEGEWEQFLEALRSPLPCTFRITGFRSESKEMLRIVKGEYLSNLVNVEIDGKVIDPPKCLPWYPNELAWQLSMERKFMRQCEQLKKLHNFMVSETESGNISRQEAVSMIPPILLDIKPHHKVLDMCAAPGSKTAQLIEFLYADEDIPVPEGFVIGNDSDNKRCYLMVHQVKRLQSPNFVVVNHDASQMPNMQAEDWNPNKNVNVQYDRVLADVPCSGDGTLRKNPDVWYKWNMVSSFNLHGLQARILKRGLEVLRVGGRLVYSTCSFNPVENEAVLANVLLRCPGAVELVEASHSLPGLKYVKGIESWNVMSQAGDWYENWDQVPDNLRTIIRPTMFPPTAEEVKSLNLNRAIRVLPHHQDTGGFFIAVLEKKQPLPWMKVYNDDKKKCEEESTIEEKVENGANQKEAKSQDEAESEPMAESDTKSDEQPVAEDETKPDDDDDNGESKSKLERCRQKRKTMMERSGSPPPNKKPKKHRGFKEDPFLFLENDDPIWPNLQKFFSVTDNFPVNQLLVRSGEGKKRNIYMTSEAIRNLVKRNQGKVKFINMGVKVLSRSESKHVEGCDYRLVQEGVNSIYPYFTGRRVSITPEDIVTILSQENPFLNKLEKDTRDQLQQLGQGSMTFVYTPDERSNTPKCDLIITGWLGKVSCRTFVPKYERAHFLRMCGHEMKTKDELMAEKGENEGKDDDVKGEIKDESNCEDVKKEESERGDMESENIDEKIIDNETKKKKVPTATLR